MKIAVLNNLYFPFNRGGAEQVLKRMILELQNSGHEVFLISTKPASAIIDNNKQLKIYYLNSNFYKLDQFPVIFRFFWQLSNLLSCKKYYQIKKILSNQKPDLVITHNLMGLGFLTPRAIKKLKIPHEHILHDIQLLYPSGLMLLGEEAKIDKIPARIYQFYTKALWSSVQKIISPSKWLLQEHTKRGFFPNSKLEIRPFKLPVYKPNPTADRPENLSSITFLFVGQIEDHKGIIWLINIWKKLNNPALKLIIIGEGKRLEQARQLTSGDKRIELRGLVDSEEVKKIMTKSHYLLVPSLCYENSPTVIYEAQALNLPIIASTIGGIPEMLSSRDYLFTAGSERAFKQCLSKKLNLKI